VVVENLEQAARYRRVLSLRNPDGALRGKLDLRLLRLGDDGTWAAAAPDPDAGRIVYTEGERVGFEIESRHAAPLYVSVLDLGVAGGLGLLYPAAGDSEQLAAGGSLRVGVRDGDELVLAFPEGAALRPDPTDGGAVEGTETFKLIATAGPADFGSLLQHGFRSVGGARSTAEELMALALGAGGRRDVSRPVTLPAADAWVTVERAFSLRRGAG
jgi:hypothetical protein